MRTRRPLWPRLATLAQCLAVTAALLVLLAPRGHAAEVRVVTLSSPSSGSSLSSEARRLEAPSPPADALFEDLYALEDASLEDHRAAGLTNGELALVIIFLIILFPVGVILLIVFLVT